ncbi:MAG: ubiquitin [Peptococcaceae bacterium BICA1-7]|nr:MAG: ubiquitin [Peptococcaceae bacterium BICA1-7]HBV98386.1 ubiquitin [Desulfotomaculum sp.]
MTTLEQVEKLSVMANISYEEAKDAIDKSNGDLLEAIIYLEKQGKIHAPAGGGHYSSEKTIDTGAPSYKDNYSEKNQHNCNKGKSFINTLKNIGKFCLKMFHKGNTNSFEVLKSGEVKASFPVTVLAVLLIFAFWVTIPLIIIGLFFGLRYRFSGPDFSGTTINDAMNSASEAAENLKKSINI